MNISPIGPNFNNTPSGSPSNTTDASWRGFLLMMLDRQAVDGVFPNGMTHDQIQKILNTLG